jgi:hypothetical protein
MRSRKWRSKHGNKNELGDMIQVSKRALQAYLLLGKAAVMMERGVEDHILPLVHNL